MNNFFIYISRLKAAFDKAQEESERLKHEKRLKRLEQGGHNTARLHHQFTGKTKSKC